MRSEQDVWSGPYGLNVINSNEAQNLPPQDLVTKKKSGESRSTIKPAEQIFVMLSISVRHIESAIARTFKTWAVSPIPGG